MLQHRRPLTPTPEDRDAVRRRWERQEKALLEAGYRVIAYDRRGFGLSEGRISDAAVRASFNVAAAAPWFASYACVDTWVTDFRADLPKIDIPLLVIHGTADRVLPFPATAERLKTLVDGIKVVPIENGPHNVGWTFPDEVNQALLDFLA